MKLILVSILSAAVLCGCGKKDKTVNPAALPVTNAPGETANAPKPLEGVVDPALTAALKAFVQEKGRLPQNLLELKNAKLDSLPRAPTGFIYAIDPATVEVKMVRQ